MKSISTFFILLLFCSSWYIIQPENYQLLNSERLKATNERQQTISGVTNYWKQIRGNLKEGEVCAEDYLQVIDQIKHSNAKRNTGIGLEFEPVGPVNMGGRTRSLLVDINDPNIVYAAGITGGVYKSTNGGNSWFTTFGNEEVMSNSFLAQGGDGTLYLATGSSPFQLATSNQPNTEPGIGILTSTDKGESWSLIRSTAVNVLKDPFAHISEIDLHPTNPNIVAVATMVGLFVSYDSGMTWKNDLICAGGIPIEGEINSIEFSRDGRYLWVGSSSGVFYTVDGISEYNSCSGRIVDSTDGWIYGSRRMKLSASVINPEKIYVALTDGGDELIEILESSDGGMSFNPINPIIPRSNPNFNLFKGDAWYNLLFKVVPNAKHADRENIWIGGTQLWRYDGNWTKATTTTKIEGARNPFYMHPYHHVLVFDKSNPNNLYFGNDGGVFKSIDGGYEFYDVNKGYRTTQFYSLAIANFDFVTGGLLDQGTVMISGEISGNEDYGYTIESSGKTYNDGHDVAISNIAPVKFSSSPFNNTGRSNLLSKNVESVCGVYCNDNGSFYSSLALWESKSDPTSRSFIEFKCTEQKEYFGFGNGSRMVFKGKLSLPQTSAKIDLSTLKIGPSSKQFSYQGNGKFSGPGEGMLNENTLEFEVKFNEAPRINESIAAQYDVSYPTGSVITAFSNSANIPVNYTLTTDLNKGESVIIQDPVQSLLAMSVSGECEGTQSMNQGNCSTEQGIVLSRNAINVDKDLNWMFVPTGGRRIYRMVFSPDGDKLFGSSGNQIVRLKGLNEVYKPSDVANVARSVIRGFQGTITGMSLHPADPETLIVTTGNYGLQTDHVYIVTGALGNNPQVIRKGGDLPFFPVYDAIFDMTNPERVILGTDKGVWTCSDIWAANPEYVQENATFGRYPVVDVDQQTLPHGQATNREIIYFGTHGAGIWKSGSVVTSVEPKFSEIKELKTEIKMFPNPATSNVQVEYSIVNPEQVQMRIYSITGNVMKTITPSTIKGENTIDIPVNDLPSGSYFINLIDGNTQKTAKFIKM